MKYCPSCFNKRADTDNYCWLCGSRLVRKSPLVCSKCSRSLDPADNFCPDCGAKLK